jgi:MYXO-CTERM domain-containing protein
VPLLPPPLVVVLAARGLAPDWTSYVTPAATWPASALPLSIAVAGPPPPGISLDAFDAALRLVAPRWALPACTAMRTVVGAPSNAATSFTADGKNEVFVHTTDWPSPLVPLALAQTIIFTSGTDVVEADIHVNAHDWQFAASAGGSSDTVWDLRSVLTHELGHVLGIGHSADPRATMYAGLPPGLAARSLEADDLAAICALYPVGASGDAGAIDGTLDDCAIGASCPSGSRCIGHACEWPDEPETLGAPCGPSSESYRCAAAGDTVSCVATSAGERCATSCGGDAATTCGAALDCVGSMPAWCLPIGDALVAGDAGGDSASEAGTVDALGADAADASGTPPPEHAAGCATGRATSSRSALLVMLSVAAVFVRRRRACRACR